MAALGPPKKGSKDLPSFKKADVATRVSPTSSWVIYERGVYDITAYVKKHPGGEKILQDLAGTDIAPSFETFFHSRHARQILQSLQIGWLADAPTRKLLAPPGAPAMGGSGPGLRPQLGQKGAMLSPTPGAMSPAPKALNQPKIPPHAAPLVLASREYLLEDTALVLLAGKLPFALAPGQHVMVWAQLGSKIIRRPYTPVSSSAAGVLLLVKRYQGGEMSTFLHSAAASSDSGKSGLKPPGASLTTLLSSPSLEAAVELVDARPTTSSAQQLWVTGPYGSDICSAVSSPSFILMFAAGTGVTAFWTYLQEVVCKGMSAGALLVWSVSKVALPILDQLAAMRKATQVAPKNLAAILSIVLVGAEGGAQRETIAKYGWKLEGLDLSATKRLDPSLVRSLLQWLRAQGTADCTAFVCGPPAYNEEVEGYLRADSFSAPVHRFE